MTYVIPIVSSSSRISALAIERWALVWTVVSVNSLHTGMGTGILNPVSLSSTAHS